MRSEQEAENVSMAYLFGMGFVALGCGLMWGAVAALIVGGLALTVPAVLAVIFDEKSDKGGS